MSTLLTKAYSLCFHHIPPVFQTLSYCHTIHPQFPTLHWLYNRTTNRKYHFLHIIILWTPTSIASKSYRIYFKHGIKLTMYGNCFDQSWKGRSNETIWHQKNYLPLFVENYYWALSMNSETRLLRQEKIASRKVSSLASWIVNKNSNRQEASREIKLKSNESWLPKFYKLKPTEKANSTREFR